MYTFTEAVQQLKRVFDRLVIRHEHDLCVRCKTTIKGDELIIALYTSYGPMHRGCGYLLNHADRYGGKQMTTSVRDYGLN